MDPFQLALAASDGVEGGVHVLEEDAAFPCELDAAVIPVDEPDAETFLMLADGFADSGLADLCCSIKNTAVRSGTAGA